jgi:hypothetical protein
VKFILIFLSVTFFSISHASTVLVVGDSQSTGPFGKKLDELLRANHTVVTRGACGTIGKNWNEGTAASCAKWNWGRDVAGNEITSTQTPKLNQLVDQINPDYVVLQFGGNYRSKLSDPTFSIPNDVADLIKTAKKNGAKCLFVSGPDTYKQRELLDDTIAQVQKGVGSECEFFNSLEVTTYPDQACLEKRADGWHYSFQPEGEPLAHAWAEKVFAAFTEMKSNSLSSDLDQLNSRE